MPKCGHCAMVVSKKEGYAYTDRHPYGVPCSHLFPELQISSIHLELYSINLEISPIHLDISPIHLEISPIQLQISTNIPI